MNLLLIILAVLVFIVVAIAKFKIHPFITLILAAIMMGFFMGLDGTTILNTISEGFGNTLSSIGIIIGLGAVIGTFLEKSGGTSIIAKYILKLIGDKKSPLAMNLTGILVSIPVFCDSGFIILSSLNKALSKKTGISMVVFVVALSTGLYVSHVFIPPTPGPLAAAAALEADLGLVILLGIAIALPTAFVGYLWAVKSGKKLTVTEETTFTKSEEIPESKSSFLAVLLPILIPIVLIALRSIAQYPSHPFGEGTLATIFSFIGHPLPALFIGILFAVQLVTKNTPVKERLTWISSSLKEAGVIILITGAGGAFGSILRSGNLGEIIEANFSGIEVGIFLPFLLAAILKTAQGSSTVSIITTATIIAPMMGTLGLDSELSRALSVLAIGAGAMTVSHINDSYFWVVSQFSGMDTKTTLKSHSLATLFQGITAIVLLSVIQIFV
ncbi:GntP family permease [Aureisphaera sp. CAU 1614]|uniref:GntP family permease n=1 Tax=Halomarinibacterium sedimenti TaxID=2857106 RepID=A0A9X1JVC0_9FLAO|nr:GntP family permease [Halomarinibacterium sedimenti]MBW2937819.1 GntP family permease [Halomarinibacterium sedimenti]